MNGFSEHNVTSQAGKTFVITGANSGLGFESARVLAEKGGRVVMACRDQDKAEDAMVRIRGLSSAANLVFLSYDQGDLASIRAAAVALEAGPPIDVLINNAGVMQPALVRTKQGFEQNFGINHLGSFAFTGLLLPKLAKTAGARVVVTGSLSHRTGRLHFDDLNAEKGYDKSKRYDDSKLANLLFLYELDRRLRSAGSSVIAVGCHPGLALTDLARDMTLLSFLKPILKLLRFNTAAMGAWPTLQAATGSVEPGAYYGPIGLGGIRGPSGRAKRAANSTDAAVAERLWNVSIEQTGVDPGLPAADGSRAPASSDFMVDQLSSNEYLHPLVRTANR